MSYSRYSKPEVAALSRELSNVVDDWDKFAMQLPGVTITHLSSARVDRPGNLAQQKLYVFQKWRDIDPRATWNDVAVALRDAQLITEADDLEKKLIPASCGSTTQSGIDIYGMLFVTENLCSRSSCQYCE